MSVSENKKQHEQAIITEMIACYVRHHRDDTTLKEMNELLDYALRRIEQCPKTETKTFCSNCSIKCYNSEMQSKVKKVMRFSGKRMLMTHPILVIKHILIR